MSLPIDRSGISHGLPPAIWINISRKSKIINKQQQQHTEYDCVSDTYIYIYIYIYILVK